MNNEASNPTEQTFSPSKGRFNRSALKKQFKFISTVTRDGKFTRVSEATVEQLEARVESKIRDLAGITVQSPIGGCVKKSPDVSAFFTGLGKQRIIEAFENFLVSEAQRIVNDTRTGSTL